MLPKSPEPRVMPSSSSRSRVGTAWLPELHGRNSSLHRHPLFHNTYGEPPVLPLLAAGPCYSGHGAPYRERVGQGHLRSLGTQAQHTHAHTATTSEPLDAVDPSKPHGCQGRAVAHRARNAAIVAWPPPARAPDHRPEHHHHRPEHQTTVARSAGSAWRLLVSPILFARATGNSRARRDHPAGAS